MNLKVNRTHLIQPFIETCEGSMEAYLDYVALKRMITEKVLKPI